MCRWLCPPQVLSGCDAFLRKGLATPGLFRQEAEPQEIAALRARVEAAYADRRRLDLNTLTRNWHAVAGLLMLFLRELPKTLLSFDLYPYFIACGASDGNQMIKLGQLADLLGHLPASTLRRCARTLIPCHNRVCAAEPRV